MNNDYEDLKQKISGIKRTLEDLQSEFDHRAITLESRLQEAEEALIAIERIATTDKAAPAVESVVPVIKEEISLDRSPWLSEKVIEEAEPAPAPAPTPSPKTAPSRAQVILEPPTPKEPGVVSLFFEHIYMFILSLIVEFATSAAAPVKKLWIMGGDLHRHYQGQGKAPVFFMTLAGLIALTVGFGYLLQYSFYNLFSEELKAISGFVVGCAIIGVGVFIDKRKPGFSEYAASVIALGVIFNFLTAYFVGPYFKLVGETISMAILLAVVAVSFYLSLAYKTKIVAVVTLFGGLLMPFIMSDIEVFNEEFLIYMTAFSAGNLVLSYKIKWPVLSLLTYGLSLGVIEYIGLGSVSSPVTAIAVPTLLFFMYTYFWSYSGVKIKEELDRHSIIVLLTNTFYFIYTMMSLRVAETGIASIMFIYSVIFIAITFKLNFIKSILAPIYILIAGSLFAAGAFKLLPGEAISLVWALEALSIYFVGSYFKNNYIRAEGALLYLLSMPSVIYYAVMLFDAAPIPTQGNAVSWAYLFVIGVYTFAAYRIIDRYKESLHKYELKAGYLLNEVFSFWGVVILLSLIAVLTSYSVTAVLVVIPLSWSFFRTARHKLKFTQFTGYVLSLYFVWQVASGFESTGNSILLLQSAPTIIALIELILFAWLIGYLYRHFDIPGKGAVLAERLNKTVLYVPLILLVSSMVDISRLHIASNVPLEFSALWYDFFILGAIFVLWYKVASMPTFEGASAVGMRQYILSESLSLYGAVFFLYTVSLVSVDWLGDFAAIPLLYLLYRGVKFQLPYTEKLAYLCFAFFGITAWLSFESVGNYIYSEQSWPAKIAMAEALVCAWLLKMIYEKTNPTGGLFKVAHIMRIGVYLLIPVLLLPHIVRLYVEYLPAALWGSFIISWLMYKKLQISILLKEIEALFFISSAATIYIVFSALQGLNEFEGVITLIVGMTALGIFALIEKIKDIKLDDGNGDNTVVPYKRVIILSPYYFMFAITALVYAFTNNLMLSSLACGVIALFLITSPYLVNIMKPTLDGSFFISLATLITPAILLLVTPGLVTSTDVDVIVILMSLVALHIATHKTRPSLETLREKYLSPDLYLIGFHVVVFVSYLSASNLLFDNWGVITTISMLVHAVVMLFLTIKPRYTCLLRVSIVLYVLTGAKVIFNDMGDFEIIHKIIALMCIGVILMGSAYMFHNLKTKIALERAS